MINLMTLFITLLLVESIPNVWAQKPTTVPTIKPKVPTFLPTISMRPGATRDPTTAKPTRPTAKPKVPTYLPTISMSPGRTRDPTTVKPTRPTAKPKVPTASPSAPSFIAPAPSSSLAPTTAKPLYAKPTGRPTFMPKVPTPASPNPVKSPTIRPVLSTPSLNPARSPTIAPPVKLSNRPTSAPTIKSSSSSTNKPTAYPKPTSKPSSFAPASKPITSKPTATPVHTSSYLSTMWSSAGGNIVSSRHVDNDHTLVRSLNIGINLGTPKFFWETGGSVQTAPAVNGDYVIFPTSFTGNLTCFNKTSGALIWHRKIGSYVPAYPKATSRTSPVYYGNSFFQGVYGPAILLKLNTATGALEGQVTLDSFGYAILLQSGTIYKDNLLIGVASNEEGATTNDSFPCCRFGGSFHSVNAKTMTIQWTWRSIPLAQKGFKSDNKLSGNPFWGPSPSVDVDTGIVYIASGNNYNENQILLDCLALHPDPADWEEMCHKVHFPENWFNSVIALNTTNGAKVWARRMNPWDAWNYACKKLPVIGTNCPTFKGLDADFGMAPTLSTLGDGVTKVLYISQKNGVTYCMNATDGALLWDVVSSPGGQYGGHNWGIAVDDKYVYTSIINMNHDNWTLVNGTKTNAGGWSALDKVTGKVIWTTANPATFDLPPGVEYNRSPANGRSQTAYGASPPLSIGDMVLVGSADSVYLPNVGTFNPTYGSGGYVYALSKVDGRIQSSFETKAAVFGGFSADWNCVYVGSGGNRGRGFSVGKGVYVWCV